MRRVKVVVVGGGPAGLSAATVAAEAGAEVVLFDENPQLGGQMRYRLGFSSEELIGAVRAAGVELRTNAVVWGLFAGGVLAISEPGGGSTIQAEQVVLATGSTDLPFPFPGGTQPGVMSARACQILIHVHRLLPGRSAAVIGAGAEAEEVARDLALAGCEVVARIDPEKIGRPIEAVGSDGIEAIVVSGERYDVDLIVVAVGRQPDPELALIAECAFRYSTESGGFVPNRDAELRTSVPGLLVAGDAGGVCDVETSIAEGRLAGQSAAAALACVAGGRLATARGDDARAVGRRVSTTESRAARVMKECLICRCEEIGEDDVRRAISAGAQTVNDVKRQTRAGMGVCQGVYCVPAIANLLCALTRASIGAIAPMTARPPVRPVPVGTIAGGE